MINEWWRATCMQIFFLSLSFLLLKTQKKNTLIFFDEKVYSKEIIWKKKKNKTYKMLLIFVFDYVLSFKRKLYLMKNNTRNASIFPSVFIIFSVLSLFWSHFHFIHPFNILSSKCIFFLFVFCTYSRSNTSNGDQFRTLYNVQDY